MLAGQLGEFQQKKLFKQSNVVHPSLSLTPWWATSHRPTAHATASTRLSIVRSMNIISPNQDQIKSNQGSGSSKF
jgi:hypothetical protein